MGDYAYLNFGNFVFGDWKSYVPLEPFILFTAEDYSIVRLEEELLAHKFIVTASTARERADARGLTLASCERLFYEFRTDAFWHYSVRTNRRWKTPNQTTFEQYLSACSRIFKKYKSWYDLILERNVNKRIRRIFSDGFFSGGAFSDANEGYFQDAQFCIEMRAFLEIVPSDCKIILDISELVWGERFDLESIPYLYDDFMETMQLRIGLDYQLYGFVLEDDPNIDRRLKAIISDFPEAQFIEHVLLPLLGKMGFQRVRKVEFHGRNEFGSDILPFQYTTPLGTIEYYALQAKAVRIHGKSAKEGNAGELISQATQALNIAFVDDLDNERKKIDKFIIATNKVITAEARHAVEGGLEGKRQLIFLDVDRIVALVKQHRLVQYLLFTPFE